MKQLDRGMNTCLLALVAALGCGGHGADGVRIGGETNWLASCISDNDCGVGHCLCNVCTVECTPGADTCGGAPSESRCAPASELGQSCGVVIGGGLCVASESSVVSTPEPTSGSGAGDESIWMLDGLVDILWRDLYAQPAEARRFTRYLSVANYQPFDAQGPRPSWYIGATQRGRLAVTKLANSLSSRPQPSIPVSVDDARLLQRIDLRAYSWDRPVSVDGVQYADGWEAIVAHAALAVELESESPDGLPGLSGTRVPWLFANDFVAAASTGNTYYELLGLPETLAELQQRLAPAAVIAPPSYRAAFENSGVSLSTRVVERRQRSGGGAYWQTFDFGSDARGAAVYQDPLGFVPDGSEAMFTLPNGLHGFFIADASGRRVSESPLSPETIADPHWDRIMRNAASCFGCHNAGTIPFEDELRSQWEEASLDPQTQAVLDLYAVPDVLGQYRIDDNEAYAQAAEAAGFPRATPDAVSRVYLDFRYGTVLAEQAAAELLVTPAQLRARLNELPELLQWLDISGLTRADFNAVYLEALCTLHQTDQVVPARCR